MQNNKLAIIVPCFNEEAIINYSIEQLLLILNTMIDDELISYNSKICFINDGSSDETKKIIKNYCKNDKISLINLSKNFGQQSAILAGLYTVNADIYITIDADLQDDYTLMADMVKKYQNGFDIIYGCRKKRKTDSFFKRNSALLFYKLMKFIGINIRENHSEFRLMSKFAIEKLKEYKEKTIFLRGIVQSLGLKSCNVYYDRLERCAGKTKYSIFKLIELAWCGITSFSFLPLRLITSIGFLTFFTSLFLINLNQIIFIIAFFSSLILISLGIIGEYLSKILIEVKNRPLYQIEEIINL